MKKIFVVIAIAMMAICQRVHAQDSATVYFYRGDTESKFKILDNNIFVEWISGSQVIQYICTAGKHSFHIKSEGRSEGTLHLTLQPGSVHYLRSGIGYTSRLPGLQETGKQAFTQINQTKIVKIRSLALQPRETKYSVVYAMDTATVYIYRGDFGDPESTFEIQENSHYIGSISGNQAVQFVCTPGEHSFTIQSKKGPKGTRQLNLGAGSVTYFRSGLDRRNTPGLQDVDTATARAQLDRMKLRKVQSSRLTMLKTWVIKYDDPDTVRALKHLFHRKHRNGVVRVWIFGMIGFFTIVNTARNPNGVQNNRHGGVEAVVSDDSTPPTNFIILLSSGIMLVTGVIQASSHNVDALANTLNDYRKSHTLPARIKKKLKPRDF